MPYYFTSAEHRYIKTYYLNDGISSLIDDAAQCFCNDLVDWMDLNWKSGSKSAMRFYKKHNPSPTDDSRIGRWLNQFIDMCGMFQKDDAGNFILDKNVLSILVNNYSSNIADAAFMSMEIEDQIKFINEIPDIEDILSDCDGGNGYVCSKNIPHLDELRIIENWEQDDGDVGDNDGNNDDEVDSSDDDSGCDDDEVDSSDDDEINTVETESEAEQSEAETVIGTYDITCDIEDSSDMDCVEDEVDDDAADDAADEDLEERYFETMNGAEWDDVEGRFCDGEFVDGQFVDGQFDDGFDDEFDDGFDDDLSFDRLLNNPNINFTRGSQDETVVYV